MCVRRTVLVAAITFRTVLPVRGGVVAVAARMFSEEQLRSFPDIGRDDLIRYFTLTQADAASWIRDVAGARLTGWVLPFSSARCRGWGSCRMR